VKVRLLSSENEAWSTVDFTAVFRDNNQVEQRGVDGGCGQRFLLLTDQPKCGSVTHLHRVYQTCGVLTVDLVTLVALQCRVQQSSDETAL